MELGDEILSVDSTKFKFYDQFVDKLALSKDSDVTVQFVRKGVNLTKKSELVPPG